MGFSFTIEDQKYIYFFSFSKYLANYLLFFTSEIRLPWHISTCTQFKILQRVTGLKVTGLFKESFMPKVFIQTFCQKKMSLQLFHASTIKIRKNYVFRMVNSH